MATLNELKKELEPYKNTLVITDSNEIAMLVNVINGKYDYYWVYDTKKRYKYESCVGGWIPLKGFIREEDYNRLTRQWNLNNIEKAV